MSIVLDRIDPQKRVDSSRLSFDYFLEIEKEEKLELIKSLREDDYLVKPSFSSLIIANKLCSLDPLEFEEIRIETHRSGLFRGFIESIQKNRGSEYIFGLEEASLLYLFFPILEKAENQYLVKTQCNLYHHLFFALSEAQKRYSNNEELALAAFLHDIGKAETEELIYGNKHLVQTFHKHEIVGSQIAWKWLRENKYPREKAEKVVKLIRHHMYRFEEDTKDSTYRDWLLEVGQDWKDILYLRLIDREANPGRDGKPLVTQAYQRDLNRIFDVLAEMEAFTEKELNISRQRMKELTRNLSVSKRKKLIRSMLEYVNKFPEKNNESALVSFFRIDSSLRR